MKNIIDLTKRIFVKNIENRIKYYKATQKDCKKKNKKKTRCKNSEHVGTCSPFLLRFIFFLVFPSNFIVINSIFNLFEIDPFLNKNIEHRKMRDFPNNI